MQCCASMLTLICYRIVDEEAIYITMYFTYMYLFPYFCMYFNLQGTSYLIFIFFFSLPSKCVVLTIKIKTLYIKYCTGYENKFNHESWLLKHISSSLEMIWSYNYIFFFLIKFDTCIWSPHYGNAFIFIYKIYFFAQILVRIFPFIVLQFYLFYYIYNDAVKNQSLR